MAKAGRGWGLLQATQPGAAGDPAGEPGPPPGCAGSQVRKKAESVLALLCQKELTVATSCFPQQHSDAS